MATLDTHVDHRDGNLSPIKRFFENTTVFITGGTGFIGMLLLEKLLVSCPNISKIYMLTRSKKGKNVQARLDKLFDDVIFSRLREQYPNFREKIVPVEGDCELPGLGINVQDRTMLIKEVNIVFHAAATVRFDAPLKKASFINVRAVRDIVQLAQEMENLKSFVHISTAFSNCVHNHIKEEFYPPSIDYKKLLCITEELSDDIISVVTPLLVGDYPNTYSFTKQIAEDIIRQEGPGLPIGIHRPSIVISTYKEPLKGWINNYYGPAGLITAGGLGLGKTAVLDNSININVIPGDLVVNSIIASAWDIAETFGKGGGRSTGDLPIYNFEGSKAAKLTWDYMIKCCLQYYSKYYTIHAIWHCTYIPCQNRLSYTVLNFFLHILPAVLVDTVRFCLGKPPIMVNTYKKMNSMLTLLQYFVFREWSFDSENVSKLRSKMSAEDRETFFSEVKDIDWFKYFDYYTLGLRVYLLKDPLETLPEAKKKARRLYWLHQFTKGILAAFCIWILWCFFSLVLRFTF